MVARDIEDNRALDLNTIYACCAGTTKQVGTSFSDPANVPDALEILHLIAGGEAAWRARPFVSNSNCFVVPPMKFAAESCETMEACIRGGMPVLLLSAGMSGATAPSTIAGAIVQSVAECLAGLVYVNAIAPGHPAIFGTWPFGLDLRTGAMCLGSGEQALLSAGCAQMHAFYGLPRRNRRRRRGFETAGHAGGLGTDVFQLAGRSVRGQHDLRSGGHACLAPGLPAMKA